MSAPPRPERAPPTPRPESFVVKRATRSPGSTPNRSTYVAAADASITPGRSFPAKATKRSCAPVASTTRAARMCQRRSSVRGPLVRDHVAVVVDAEGGRAGEDRDAVWRLVDPVAFVHQHHAVAAVRRGDRRPAPGGTAADDQRLDVHVPVHCVDRGHLARDREVARRRLAAPRRARPRARPSCAATIASNQGSLISTNAFGSSGPAVITPRGRPRIGLRNPPIDPVREKRARERVPFEALVLGAVEPERDRLRAVDPASRRRRASGSCRRLLVHPVRRDEPVCRGVPDRVEPAPAAVDVIPALAERAQEGCRA